MIESGRKADVWARPGSNEVLIRTRDGEVVLTALDARFLAQEMQQAAEVAREKGLSE